MTSYIASLPSSLKQAVKASSVKSVNSSADALTILTQISSSQTSTSSFDETVKDGSSPAQCQLYDAVNFWFRVGNIRVAWRQKTSDFSIQSNLGLVARIRSRQRGRRAFVCVPSTNWREEYDLIAYFAGQLECFEVTDPNVVRTDISFFDEDGLRCNTAVIFKWVRIYFRQRTSLTAFLNAAWRLELYKVTQRTLAHFCLSEVFGPRLISY